MSKSSYRDLSSIGKGVLLLGALLGTALPGTTLAKDFTVTTSNDGYDNAPGDGYCNDGTGQCTLRAAIQEANHTKNYGLDTIYLQSDVYLLRNGTFEDLGRDGDLDITDHLTIIGSDSARNGEVRLIHGQGNDRVMHILNGAKVTLKNLEISGGLISVSSKTPVPKGDIPGGGGILVEGASTLDMENVNIHHNEVAGESSFILTGGGLYIDALAKATIKDSRITHNIGPGGGGFTNLGRTEVRNTTIYRNEAGSAYGGGIRNMGGYLYVGNSVISGNRAAHGGGIDSTDLGQNLGNVIISNTHIDSNIATNFGGGIHNLGPLTLSNSTVSYNRANQYGGGIYNTALGNIDIINATISGNDGGFSGGGIYNNREVTLTNVTLYNNTATPGPAIDCDAANPNKCVGGNQIAIVETGAGSATGITLGNTLIANGPDSSRSTSACSGVNTYTRLIYSLGGNLEGESDGNNIANDGNSCGLNPGFSKAPDQINVTVADLKLELDLTIDANHPETTPVHALLTGSAAINKGNDSICPQLDQRFLKRVARCDTGAYEFGASQSMVNDLADVKVTISDSVDPARPNDEQAPLTYKILVANLYVNTGARNIEVEVKLPNQFRFSHPSYNSSTLMQPDCDDLPNTQGYFRCYISQLPGLGQVEIFLTGTPTVDKVTIVADAGITLDNDAFQGNNTDREETLVDSEKGGGGRDNFGGTNLRSGGGGGSLHPLWLLPLGGLLLARRLRRH